MSARPQFKVANARRFPGPASRRAFEGGGFHQSTTTALARSIRPLRSVPGRAVERRGRTAGGRPFSDFAGGMIGEGVEDMDLSGASAGRKYGPTKRWTTPSAWRAKRRLPRMLEAEASPRSSEGPCSGSRVERFPDAFPRVDARSGRFVRRPSRLQRRSRAGVSPASCPATRLDAHRMRVQPYEMRRGFASGARRGLKPGSWGRRGQSGSLTFFPSRLMM